MNQFHDPGQERWVGFREDAVAQVENVARPICCLAQNRIYGTFDNRPRREHERRIQVALDRDPLREASSRRQQAGTPIYADRLASTSPDVMKQRVGPRREVDGW